MDDFYDLIQYVVPENTEICFNILPVSRNVSLKLLDGDAVIHVDDKQTLLSLQQEFSLQLWECLSPRLTTKTGCNFLVRGDHYVSSAVQHGLVEIKLFGVSLSGNMYSFVLEKDIQLQIFPGHSDKPESCITIGSSQGAPETNGFILPRLTNHRLSPFSPVLLKSSDEKTYTVYVIGLGRKVKLCMREKNIEKCANDAKKCIFDTLARKDGYMNSTILVLGPKNVGKTSFCQLLVNETLQKRMTPVYVDLNLTRNLSLPGSLSLSKIESRIDCSLDLNYNIENLFHFGGTDIPFTVARFYYFLIKQMAELLTSRQIYNNKEKGLVIIDTDGYYGENNLVIEFILKKFSFDLVVYMGDYHYYDNLTTSTLQYVPSEFIPKPRNAEKPSKYYEESFYQLKIQEYFFGSIYPSTSNACTIPLHQISIYAISLWPNEPSATLVRPTGCRIERIGFNASTKESLLNNLFGVSAAEKAELAELVEIQFYVYFTDIDMTAKVATVMVPASENFNGGILLKGFIPKPEDSAIL